MVTLNPEAFSRADESVLINEPAENEQSVELVSAKNTLHGTLTLPRNDASPANATGNPSIVAAVLLLADSGPLDRNQNSIQVQLNIFNDIANCLAKQGIASLRYDKRGCGLSKGKFDAAGHYDLVADAQAWLEYLHNCSLIEGAPVFVLGHGEGSLIAPQLCTANTYVRGQILLTPFVEDYENVIKRQAENALREIAELEGFRGKLIRFFLMLSGNQLAKQRKLIQKIRKTRRDTLKIRKQLINAKWIRDMVTLDARSIHSKASLPTLIIGGQKDLQCLPDDVEIIAALLSAPVQSHVLADLTHILRPDTDKPSVQHYLKLSLEDVDRRLIELIIEWLQHRSSENTVESQIAITKI